MSIRQNFPTTPPSLVLDFANSKTLDPRITFSRTTTATRVNELGLIETVSADMPRLDHEYDASTGAIKSLGLLVEEQRSNLFNHTEDFTQLPVSGVQDGWFRGRVIPTTESVTAPDGSSSVSLLTENNTSFGEHYVSQEGFNYTSGVTYTWSWYVKPNGRDNVYCKVYTNFNNTQVILNLETSSEYYLTGTTFDNITNTKLPNGWYRVSFTSTAISTGAGSVLLGFAQSETVRSYTGDGSSGMYYWGAQVEAGAFPTSYIPNGTDSQATRNPDNVSMTGDNFSDWYNSSEWTLMVTARRNYSGNFISYPNLLRMNDGTLNNNVAFYGAQGSTQLTNYSINSGGVNQTDYVARFLPDTSQFKMIQALKINDSTFGVNGTLTTTDTTVTMPTGINRMFIGSDGSGQFWGGTISKLSYYPTRLSNDQLQTLTK